MLKLQPTFSIKKIGVPLFAAGLVILANPSESDANELGDKNLASGDKGSTVEELQDLLHDQGLLEKDEVDGEFDKETAQAIESYQDEHNLNKDGIAGPHTIGALEILGEGDEGKPVETLQEKLKNLGFYEYASDGKFGPHTDEAVRDFQQAANILVDGLAGPQTFSAIEKDAAKKSTSSSEEVKASEKEAKKQSKETSETTEKVASEQSSNESNTQSEGRTLQVNATAYTADCTGCSGITATGVDLNANRNAKVIAVDPDVIPLGSKVRVEGHGVYTAADTGGAINGNRIDIHMPNKGQALEFGRRNLEVTILN
ncbi:peptidoglycan-binding protein [Alteribacillus iranensis]|uniref:3D (Asp-Asp-Asp) domain-containing protein n=1 Tax=Alteribacillus iranensis TaxID=930128 RepID=A0A1I2FCD6_9BACI|nr:peptidoglycan-binding protein [Alteribacillus iranensis]SFF02418.1 3D (Asp-Asp-Asp) domain-containing protein [Alteribacillus iranensis]